MRVALATAGRFHLLDLARELDVLGLDVKFYSQVPRRRARAFGLPASVHVGLLRRVWPWVLLQRLFPRLATERVEAKAWYALNRALEQALLPCDVLVCMSGIYLEAAIAAKRRFGAKVILVRSSQHILAQDEILARTPGAERPSPLAIERELAGYQLADVIDVPSAQVARSFERDPTAMTKIRINPLGVDLGQFPLLAVRPPTRSPTLVFAGRWSLQKGCDLLADAMAKDQRFRLIHVGSLGDAPFPATNPRVRHIPAVDQSELHRVYAEADALVLPSRQDGFGLVLAQALASGLPVLCTDATGGPDLRQSPALAERIMVVASERQDALEAGLDGLAKRLAAAPGFGPLSAADRALLSWNGYARRYLDTMTWLVHQPSQTVASSP